MNHAGDIARFQGKTASDADVEEHIATLMEVLLRPRPTRHAEIRQAYKAYDANRTDIAEQLVRDFLKRRPRDPDALYLLGQCLLRGDLKTDAEPVLAESVAVAPNFDAARFAYAHLLRQLNKPVAALEETEKLLAKEPRNPLYRDLEAIILSAMGEHERAF